METTVNEELLTDEEIEDGLIEKLSLRDIIGTGHPNIERLRLFLMFCACVNMLGFPTKFGGLIRTLCGFAPIAFFILSGILVLGDPENRRQRIARSIKRTALAFVIMLAAYVGINYLVYRSMGADILPMFKIKQVWINFLAFNTWPFNMGDAIWYVQSLLYAYIIIYFLDLLRLIKLDWLLFAALFLFSIATGELNGIFHFSFMGYNAFPHNFINCALPYVLLGGLLARTVSRWTYLHPAFYIGGIALGAGLIVLEPLLLNKFNVPGYYDSLVGMPLIAVSVCLIVLQDVVQRDINDSGTAALFDFPLMRRNTNMIYYLFQPVAMVLGFLTIKLGEDVFAAASNYLGLITFVILAFIALLSGYLNNYLNARAMAKAKNSEDEDEDTDNDGK